MENRTSTDHYDGEKQANEQCTVRIISSTSPYLRNGPSDVRDVLYTSCITFGGCRTLLQIDGEPFILWTQEVFESASWTFDEAHAYLERHLLQQTPHVAVLLCSFHDPSEEKTSRDKTILISALSLKAETAKSVPISYQDRQTLEENLFDYANHEALRSTNSRGIFTYIKRNLAFVVAAIILLLMGIALAATLHRASPDPNVWLSWDLPKDSKGPKNQLQFTWPHPNFTTWSAESGRNIDDFYLRLDDQTLIPTASVDASELQYQSWYATHYPWFATLGDSRAYLNSTYWRSPRSLPLKIDHEFHVAHCVLTMKRYWKARESGRHVCPRDIDHGHISHCFGVLESYAFSGFETQHRMDPQVNGTELMWIVNACF